MSFTKRMVEEEQDPSLMNESGDDVLSELKSHLAVIDDEANAIIAFIRKDETPPRKVARSLQGADQSNTDPTKDEDEDDDDGMGDEILRLGSVVASINQDIADGMDGVSVDSCTSGLSTPATADTSTRSVPTFSALAKRQNDGLSGFFWAHGSGAHTRRLLIANIFVWGFVYLFMLYVRLGKMADDGKIYLHWQ